MSKKKNWFSLFATNFLGVLNNNFLKNIVGFIAIAQLNTDDKGLAITLSSGLYVLPYIFFSPLAGKFAKIRNKGQIMFWSKIAELPIFIISCLGLFFHSLPIVLIGILLIGLISTLFSPSKYGLIRDIGGNKGISFGTGTLEMLTFLGVLIGTFIASVVADYYSILIFSIIAISISLLEILIAFQLTKIKETEPMQNCHDTINPISFLWKSFNWAKQIKNLNLIVLGLACFWMVGSLIQMNLMVHCEKALYMNNTQTGITMTIAALGIGLGSFLTGLLSKGKVKLIFTPIGALGMIICFVILFFIRPTGNIFSIFIFFTSFFAGMYMVPLSAFVQHSVEGRMQGDMLAYSNFIIFLFILISAGLFSPVINAFDSYMIWMVLLIIVLIISSLLIIKIKAMRSYSSQNN